MITLKSLLAASISLVFLTNTVLAANCDTHSFTACEDNIVHWFDPETGQICDPHDCGGGRAPPRKDVPGCPFYTGTDTLATSASFLSCWTGFATPSSIVSATPKPVETTTTTTAEAPVETKGLSSSPSNFATATPSTVTQETGFVRQSVTATPSPSTTESPSNSSSDLLSVSGTETASPAEATTNAGSSLQRSIAVVVVGVVAGVAALV